MNAFATVSRKSVVYSGEMLLTRALQHLLCHALRGPGWCTLYMVELAVIFRVSEVG